MSKPPVSSTIPTLDAPNEKQVCTYVAEMCADLLRMTRHPRFHPRFRTIRYLLDMARLESERTAKEMPD